LADQQWNWRENQALGRRLKNAKLRVNACVEEIDYGSRVIRLESADTRRLPIAKSLGELFYLNRQFGKRKQQDHRKRKRVVRFEDYSMALPLAQAHAGRCASGPLSGYWPCARSRDHCEAISTHEARFAVKLRTTAPEEPSALTYKGWCWRRLRLNNFRFADSALNP